MFKSSSSPARRQEASANGIEETAERPEPAARPAAPPSAPQPLPLDRPGRAPEHPQGPPAGPERRDTLRRGKGRQRLRRLLMLGGIFAVIVGGFDFWLSGGRYVSSDDSYIQAPKLMVSTDISGIVKSVEVHQGEKVKPGQVLFRVDPRQYQLALDAAKAELDGTKLNLDAAEQDYQRIERDIAAQQAQVELAQATFDRAAALVRTNVTTRARYDQARFGLLAAKSKLAALQQQAKVALIKLGGNAKAPVEKLPQYLQAKARVEEAQRQLNDTVVRAPFAGIVTEVDALQPGTYLVAQTAALTNTGAIGLVGTSHVWVDSNMKETDLTYVKVGDPAEVTVDAYPGHVWHGKVTSIYPATGAEFSILPAQNSSGNWVKVVQRIPVRVALTLKPGDPRLRAGMTATVTIDTGHRRTLSELWGGGSAAKPTTNRDGSHAHRSD